MPVAPRSHSGCHVQVSFLDRSRRSLEPTLRGEEVDTPVAVDVARADAVADSLLAEVVRPPDRLFAGRFQVIPDELIGHVRKHVGLAVAGEVRQNGTLARAGLADLMVRPRLVRLTRVLDPADVAREVADRDEIHESIAIHVHRQGGKAVHVRSLAGDVPDVMRRPGRSLVPGIARDDVELAVVVDVKDPRSLEDALAVDRMQLPFRLVSAEIRSACREQAQSQGEEVVA